MATNPHGNSHVKRYIKKACTKCGEKKPSFEFQKSKRTKDGFTTQCKVCLNTVKVEHKEKVDREREINREAMMMLVRKHRVEFERIRTELRAP